jgi:Lrp/AsnC family transcriptional regulator, leucine-responsive regulatory protein
MIAEKFLIRIVPSYPRNRISKKSQYKQKLTHNCLIYINLSTMAMDRTDLRILEVLQAEGRLSNIELAEKVNLSASPCLRRVRTLEEEGFISGYAALLDPEKIGLGLTVHLDVALDKKDAKARDRLKAAVQTWSEVTWCHSLSGEMDYTMQVVMPSLKHYTSFLMDRVLTLPGVVNVKSAFVLEKVKETTVLPLTYAPQ